jgi:hypothetical protein
MQVACGALAPVRAAAAAVTTSSASNVRRAGGLLPLRRRAGAAGARVTTRRGRTVAVRASLGAGFPTFEAASATLANLHASVIISDALTPLFQIADGDEMAAVLNMADDGEIPGLQKGGWLGPITDLLENILKVRVCVTCATSTALTCSVRCAPYPPPPGDTPRVLTRCIAHVPPANRVAAGTLTPLFITQLLAKNETEFGKNASYASALNRAKPR